jgi:hypothetical protein
MRIVIAHNDFVSFGGTETYILTVAEQLQALGHKITICGESGVGPVAKVAVNCGLEVVDGLTGLPDECDAVIVNDASSALLLAARYPEAVRVLVAHSDYYALQSPPQLDGVLSGVVALNDRVARHVESLAFRAPLFRLRQPVDLKRFGVRGPLPTEARRALVLGNYLRGAAADTLAAACAEAGVTTVFVGAPSEPTSEPEVAIADADLVIGIGRCAIEAMAGRRAAYVYGIGGGDGWVTAENYESLEADGFGGTATPTVITPDRITEDLRSWNAQMGDANRQIAVAQHDAAKHAGELVELLRSLDATEGLPKSHAEELARVVRLEWRTWQRFTGAMRENQQLRQEVRRQSEELDKQRQRFEALFKTRRYRLATRLAAPLDVLRRIGRRDGRD